MKNLIIAGFLGSIFFSCQRDEDVQSVPFELSQTMLNEIQTTPAQILPV